MTYRLVLGVDPGQSGAVAALADGNFAGFIDMPVSPRKAGGFIIAAPLLWSAMRDLIRLHPGAYLLAVLEGVNAMPDQGVTGAFRFGQSDGIIRGVIGSHALPMIEVAPVRWKRALGLTGQPKDVARTLAIQRFPAAAEKLQRKKDVGRADALLIALWAEITEAVGPSRAAA